MLASELHFWGRISSTVGPGHGVIPTGQYAWAFSWNAAEQIRFDELATT